jgi:hypothetical protein
MNRRSFLVGQAVWPALGRRNRPPHLLAAQAGPPQPARVESLTARATPIVALNHLGFVPKAPKMVIVRATGESAPREFTVRDIGGPPQPFQLKKPLQASRCDFGDCLTGEFTDLDTEAMYQVSAGEERSVPFFIRPDLWRRTLPKAFGYIHAQRCGTEVPNVHAVCHTDDARRRDNGEHIDVAGGWHDAGDLRKWMSATMMNGFALLEVARVLGPEWDAAGSGLAPLLDEFRWGNRYFLKMQDTDGQVWADTAGGVNGDNSDNHWTDNRTGTADDRYVNPEKSARIQAMFTALEAAAAQAYRAADSGYAETCLAAALRCWEASSRGAAAQELAWWTRAAVELYRATGKEDWGKQAAALGRQVLALQNTQFAGSQKLVRGFWREGPGETAPYADAVHSALPPIALLELAGALDDHPDARRWLDAIRLHLEEYVLPMTSRSAYRIMPYGVFFGAPTPEEYRPLGGKLTYRYFVPVRKQFWWLGTTSHLLCYALLLACASATFSKPEYRHLAFRQIEWVMGANPFGACLMSGEGMRNPYPHSRFVGLIPGGIMNGIAGNMRDEPVLDTENGFDWRTTEYWSPHNAYYLMAVAALEAAMQRG